MNKKQKVASREALAANVAARMAVRYLGLRSENARIMKLAEEAGVGKRTIQRILSPERDVHDVTLSVIDSISKALRCEVYELLTPPEPPEE